MDSTSVNKSSGGILTTLVLNKSDIEIIKSEFINPKVWALSPGKLFDGLEKKYISTKPFRKAMQVQGQVPDKYYDEKTQTFLIEAILKDLKTLKVLKVECSDPKIESDIVIISFHFGERDYRKIYFSKSLYTEQLNKAKGETVKKDNK